MQFKRSFTVVCLLVGAAFAQSMEDALRSKIASVRYPLLCEQARIYGDVRLNLADGVVTVISGHPLLAEIAVRSAKSLGSIQEQTDIALTYHFVIADTATSVPTWVTVKRGNALERSILRMLRLKTEKRVLDYECQQGGDPPANDLQVSETVIEIWIYGRTRCLTTTTTTLVARR